MIIRIKLPKNLAHFLTYQSIIELRKLPLHGHHICLLKIQNFGLENLSFPVVRHPWHLPLTTGNEVGVGSAVGSIFEVPGGLYLDAPGRGPS